MANHRIEHDSGQAGPPHAETPRLLPAEGGLCRPGRSLAQSDWMQLREEIERASRLRNFQSTQ